jgi:hypothetical protein
MLAEQRNDNDEDTQRSNIGCTQLTGDSTFYALLNTT